MSCRAGKVFIHTPAVTRRKPGFFHAKSRRWISQIAHGLVAPQGWQPGKGFRICLWNGAPVAGKMPNLVIVNVWIMDAGYG